LNSFLTQLKQRQVFKVATIYAVSAWPLIQIADLAVPALGLPDSVMTLLLKLFLFGFPISLIFAWLYNFTSTGIVRVKDSDMEEVTPQVNVKTTIAIAGTLVLALLVTLLIQLWLEEKTPSHVSAKPDRQTIATGKSLSDTKKESIAILPFIPFSNDIEDEFFCGRHGRGVIELTGENTRFTSCRTNLFFCLQRCF
jgi:hypothetical protein